MIKDIISNSEITTFTSPEKISLSEYQKAMPGPVSNAGGEVPVHFIMNQTGNIYYACTSEQLMERSKDLFDSVTVLFAAMTRALSLQNKTLFDYAAWSNLIRSTGYFVEVQKFRSMLNIKSGALTVDTQIVQTLLPGLTSGNSMNIAKGVLSALSGEFSAEGVGEDTQLAHILFICEELFGAPSVTVRLFYASKKTHKTVTQSPCHKSVQVSYEQLQEANTFLFVDPDAIAKFAKKFIDEPEEYRQLIERLKEMVK